MLAVAFPISMLTQTQPATREEEVFLCSLNFEATRYVYSVIIVIFLGYIPDFFGRLKSSE